MNESQRGMRSKTIRAVLRKKINEWLESIEDEGLREKCAKNTIVTGGSIASMLAGTKINDYDLYFRNKETALAVAKHYVKRFNQESTTRFKGSDERVAITVQEIGERIKVVVKSAGIANEDGVSNYQYFEGLDDAQDFESGEYVERVMEAESSNTEKETKPPYRPIFLSTNAITLSNGIQIVIRFYGEPDKIHENYDFVHCTNYWTSWNSELVLRPKALEALLSRELVYVGSKYPLCSVIRTRKFIQRGWVINAGQYLKMIMQLNELKLTDLEVLEDQLIGVDVAYFHQILKCLKERNSDKVSTAYLLEILDRMF